MDQETHKENNHDTQKREKSSHRWTVIGGIAGVVGVIAAIIFGLHQMGIIQVGTTTTEVSTKTTTTTESSTTTGNTTTTKPQQYYAVGNTVCFGQYDWLVLDIQDDRALLLTKDIIGERHYNIVEDAAWETCTLRSYLNNQFYYLEFSDTERAMILTTKNNNPDNPWYKKSKGGLPTDDKIFLLSIEEVAIYFRMEEDGKEWILGGAFDPYETYAIDGNITVGVSDMYDNERIAKFNGEAYYWWLRSPGLNNDNYVAHVSSKGVLRVDGYNINSLFPGYGLLDAGVRPAMWIRIT